MTTKKDKKKSLEEIEEIRISNFVRPYWWWDEKQKPKSINQARVELWYKEVQWLKDEITSYECTFIPTAEWMRRWERMTTMKYDIDNSKDKEYCIRPFWSFYIVDKYVDEKYGLFFTKTRKVRKPLCIFWTPIVWSLTAILFRSKNEARKFIERLKNEENENSIEYL